MAQQGQPGTTQAGTDPAYVPDRDVFDAYTHQEIWDLAHEVLAPAELSRLADTWGHTATAVETAFDEFARDLTHFSGGWSGLSATAAARAATAFVRAGDDAVGVCRVVEQLLAADSAAAESVRTAIPPPPGPYLPDPDPVAEAAAGAPRRTAYNTAAAALTAAAQDAMTFGYNPTIPASGDCVPRFAPPADEGPVPGPPAAGAPARDPAATAPHTVSDPLLGPNGRGPDSPPSAAPSIGPASGTVEPGDGSESAYTDPGSGTPAGEPDEEHTEPAAVVPQPDSGAPAPPGPPAGVGSDADGAPEPQATDTPSPATGAPAAENAAATEPSPTLPTTPAGATPGPDRPEPVTTRATGSYAPSTGGGPAGAIGTETTCGPPAPATSTGGNPGPIVPSAPAANQPPHSATGSEAGSAQRPGHTEQVTRQTLPRAATEAARESFGAASTPADTTEAGDRSENAGSRAARPAGLPLPTVARPSPPRTPDSERTGPDYLRAPNEDLTATPPASPPVFGEYTEAGKPDRPEPGGGSR
ncbi:hypothetical protein [Nocardia sp. NPDC003963]